MTTESVAAKNQIIRVLRKDGYPTYARLLDMFDVYLTDDPGVIAYMIPNKAKVVFNRDLSIDQVSMLTRHELLHEYLNHGEREKNYNKLHGITVSEITHNLENMAADWEISNKGYTEKDKITAKNIILGDKVLQGLVTELDRPGWENLTFEEMYEKLLEENEKNKDSLQDLMNKLSKLSQKDLDDMQDDSEEISDEAESQESESEDSKEGKVAKDIKDKADKLGKEIGNIKDKVDDSEAKSKDSSPFDTPEEQKKKENLADRVAKIKKELKDLQTGSDMIKEVDVKKAKEAAAKKAKKIDTYNQSPMTKFRNNLIRFIRDQIATYRGSSWSKINKTYARSEIIRPGRTSYASGKVPSINVYWDVSGSFNDPAKTAGARAAIALLQQYVRDGSIVINVYYFADRVSSTIEGAGSGTSGGPILDHINQTKPTNVIIISDSDIDWGINGEYATVPGAVWMLFYESTAYEFIKHIKGKSETKVYEVTY